jgi:GH15 family glucan-1,4-alpha-glucosidase
MPRDIPVGNGTLLITFDQDYCLRDVYYPYVGQENHTDGHRFRFGVWVDGSFSWVNRRDWDLGIGYVQESLLSDVTAINKELNVSLKCSDVVDFKENIYIRTILVRNSGSTEREIRLFFHHDYHILESPAGDTAYYDPDEKALIHYKGNRYFLMSGMRNKLQGIDQYATGVKEFHSLEGTWKDAEDGELEGSPISQGSVDSVLSLRIRVPSGGEATLNYWIAAGKNYAEVSALNRMVVSQGPEHLVRRTDHYWKAWLNKEKLSLEPLPGLVQEVYRRSLLTVRTNIDGHGAIIAANDSDIQHFARDTYSYMWPRDGAFTAYAMDNAGYLGITRKFFEFCLDLVSEGKEAGGYFLHKYNPDGCLGSSWHPWVQQGEKVLPIQEDGTGLILWALWFHFDRYRDIEFAVNQYENLVTRCADFLVSYRDRSTGLPLPSYDLWEERLGIHTFTTAAVYAGLKAAENFALFFGDSERAERYRAAAQEVRDAMDIHLYSRKYGRFVRSLTMRNDGSFEEDATIDASMYAPFYFGLFGARDERVVNTMNAIRNRLWVRTAVGGVARYEGDGYHKVSDNRELVPGNPWFICTFWLAQWLIAKAEDIEELQEALPFIEWGCRRAMPSKVLAEQINPFTDHPLSVSPLTWSHAAMITTTVEYLLKLERIHLCPICRMPLYNHEKGFQEHRHEKPGH